MNTKPPTGGNLTKTNKQQKMKTETRKILDEAKENGVVFSDSVNYGKVEAWNWILCKIQNCIQEEGSEENAMLYIEEALGSGESEEVESYFRSRGITA